MKPSIIYSVNLTLTPKATHTGSTLKCWIGSPRPRLASISWMWRATWIRSSTKACRFGRGQRALTASTRLSGSALGTKLKWLAFSLMKLCAQLARKRSMPVESITTHCRLSALSLRSRCWKLKIHSGLVYQRRKKRLTQESLKSVQTTQVPRAASCALLTRYLTPIATYWAT